MAIVKIQGEPEWEVVKPKGGFFKLGAEVPTAERAEVRAPFDGKIAHWYPCKLRLPGAKKPSFPDQFQFILSEEAMVPKGHSGELTRVLTKRRLGVQKVTEKAPDVGRHVKKGDLLGWTNGLRVSGNKPGLVEEALG